MNNKFGFLFKLEFLQNWASNLIARVNPAVIHNIEKYQIIKKVFYLSAIEDLEGDYLEFGVFMGSSFSHSIRCCHNMANLNQKTKEVRFFGFDSFEGFGVLPVEDDHPFYINENFASNFDQVNKRIKRVAKNTDYKLIRGFFSESLKDGPSSYGIQKSRIIFIDSDTYSSAIEALEFCLPTVQEGTFIILDDYFSYKGNGEKGVAKAFSEFIKLANVKVRQVFNYGMGGVVFVISNKQD